MILTLLIFSKLHFFSKDNNMKEISNNELKDFLSKNLGKVTELIDKEEEKKGKKGFKNLLKNSWSEVVKWLIVFIFSGAVLFVFNNFKDTINDIQTSISAIEKQSNELNTEISLLSTTLTIEMENRKENTLETKSTIANIAAIQKSLELLATQLDTKVRILLK